MDAKYEKWQKNTREFRNCLFYTVFEEKKTNHYPAPPPLFYDLAKTMATRHGRYICIKCRNVDLSLNAFGI